ncbi:MAG: hypothetical protein E6Q49_03910 [Limnohabitans sp.]|nr:MAG: hypothetical protein E6Q49_03910 [Limnohabitans sp.]
MRIAKQLTTIALVLTTMPLAAMAGDAGTVYTQLGTNGLGIGYATSVSPNWAVRGQYNALPKQKFSGDVGDFGAGSNLTVEIDWNSAQVVADWYPAGDGFRVSMGGVFNGNKITVNGTGQVDGVNGTVNAEVKMANNGLSPYLGIGYGVKPKMDKGLGFNMDLGVMFQDPKATLSATGGPSATNIANEQRQMQDAVDKLKYFPVLSFGISYSF